jgi:hypothetical protein
VAPDFIAGRREQASRSAPALENIRRINDLFRTAGDPPAVQFRLITLLAMMTALSVLLAAV